MEMWYDNRRCNIGNALRDRLGLLGLLTGGGKHVAIVVDVVSFATNAGAVIAVDRFATTADLPADDGAGSGPRLPVVVVPSPTLPPIFAAPKGTAMPRNLFP